MFETFVKNYLCQSSSSHCNYSQLWTRAPPLQDRNQPGITTFNSTVEGVVTPAQRSVRESQIRSLYVYPHRSGYTNRLTCLQLNHIVHPSILISEMVSLFEVTTDPRYTICKVSFRCRLCIILMVNQFYGHSGAFPFSVSSFYKFRLCRRAWMSIVAKYIFFVIKFVLLLCIIIY